MVAFKNNILAISELACSEELCWFQSLKSGEISFGDSFSFFQIGI